MVAGSTLVIAMGPGKAPCRFLHVLGENGPYLSPEGCCLEGRTACVGHHVAGIFMCRQPQQKSGSKQPRSNQHQYHAEAQEPQPPNLQSCFTLAKITTHLKPVTNWSQISIEATNELWPITAANMEAIIQFHINQNQRKTFLKPPADTC